MRRQSLGRFKETIELDEFCFLNTIFQSKIETFKWVLKMERLIERSPKKSLINTKTYAWPTHIHHALNAFHLLQGDQVGQFGQFQGVRNKCRGVVLRKMHPVGLWQSQLLLGRRFACDR